MAEIRSTTNELATNETTGFAEISDLEVPRTPTLAGSNSSISLADTPLQSPHNGRFPSSLNSSPRRTLKGDCQAWWSRRGSADSALWGDPPDVHQNEQSSAQQPLHRSSLTESYPSGVGDATSPFTPTALLRGSRSGPSELKQPSFDADAAESHLGFQTSSERSTTANTVRQLDRSILTEKPPQPLEPLPLEPDISLTRPSTCETVGLVRSTSEISLGGQMHSSSGISALDRDAGSVLDITCAENVFSHLNSSRANSSMLAHCHQSSLAPPCESLAQTQCGRMALRQAGIPHGSSRALAPSLPIENVAVHSQNEGFLRRLMRKAFAKSLPMAPSSGSHPPLSTDLPTRQGSKPQLPRTTRRHSLIPAFTRTDPALASESHSPCLSKRSRWALIQRFVAKPNAAAKVAQVEDVRRTRPRASTDVGPRSRGTRVHNLASGHSSSVSFFGDPMARADPFARPGGLGATVSPPSSPEPLSHSVLYVPNRRHIGDGHAVHIINQHQHYINFPTGGGRGGSRDEGIQTISRANAGTSPSCALYHGDTVNQECTDILACGESGGGGPASTNNLHATTQARLGRRHSMPLLNVPPLSGIEAFRSPVGRG